ncbi:hypothetical protein D5S18_33680 [Nocardia panacis]|uniref:Proline rich protein n=1 Tax=Nocardia panacis TaxID=2340916 RepID=A0A3A4JIX7_9NOCA|nr:hypothetical protein [Nocardia panacis]RJO68367.1 hypothetical protein D5S18_33680 [Nocardia panacis]
MTEPSASPPREPGGDAPGGASSAPGYQAGAPATPMPEQGHQGVAAQPGYPQYGAAQPPMSAPAGPSYGPTGTIPPAEPIPPQPVPPLGYPWGGPTTLDVGNALGYGWEKFRANPAPWVGTTALGFVIYLLYVLVVQITDVHSMLPLLLIFLAVTVAIWLLQAVMVRGALYETDGAQPAFGGFFRFVNAGNVLLTALLAMIATAIGIGFFVLPGLILGFLFMFSLHFVIDQEQGPFAALKSSAVLVLNNLGQTLLLAIAVVVITFVGTLFCGLGLLIAGPMCVIAVTYAYRVLSGGGVA